MIWPCEEHMAKRWSEVFILNITAAILQLIMTIYLLIGYFWGIWWGVIMIQRARKSNSYFNFVTVPKPGLESVLGDRIGSM